MMLRRGKLEETFWVYSFAPIRGEADDFVGIFVTALDNTQQMVAQQRNAAELEQMWSASQDLMTVVGLDGTLKTVNAAWTKLLGWQESELLGQSIIEFVHPRDLEPTLEKLADVATSPLSESYEYRLRHKDGSYRWFSWTAAASNGQIYGNGRHTTQLHEQDAKLATASTDARLREEFIAVLGHDLRNPLASISAAAQMLLREPQSEKSKKILRLAQGSVIRMSGLIDNVLDFARGRLGGGISLSQNATEPLEGTLHQVVDELRTATDKPIVTDFQIVEPIICDRPRIGQLVSNLVGNAITHGATDKPVEIFASTDAGILEIRVCNQGEQIAPAAMDRLFHPFFRGEISDSQQGLGLGLHIASEIAKAHGGILEATSTPEETCFTFRMPAALSVR
ncbi:MAG: PAS domain-containing sensor histidine kinase [Devosia sp.]